VSNDFVTDFCEGDIYGDYGSKIQMLCKVLAQIHKNSDGREKCLVFTQWADLENKVARCLDTYGFDFIRLRGDSKSRNKTLTKFQYG